MEKKSINRTCIGLCGIFGAYILGNLSIYLRGALGFGYSFYMHNIMWIILMAVESASCFYMASDKQVFRNGLGRIATRILGILYAVYVLSNILWMIKGVGIYSFLGEYASMVDSFILLSLITCMVLNLKVWTSIKVSAIVAFLIMLATSVYGFVYFKYSGYEDFDRFQSINSSLKK